MMDCVAVELKKKSVRVVPDVTPVGDSQAGGKQENTVKRCKAKAMTLWQQAVEKHGVTSGDASHPLLPWCVRYAGQLINRTVVGSRGLTAWRRITGRTAYPRKLVPWGDKVMFVEGGGKAKAGITPIWREGIFLGLVDQSEE